MSQILADNGLFGETVKISEIIKLDIEGDGVDEVLIIASNANSSDMVNGQYSIVVMRKIMEGNVESIFLIKDIRTNLPTELNTRTIYEYELCEVVDLNYDGVCEFLINSEYYDGHCSFVYEIDDYAFKIVLDNASAV